ncbi:nucleotidyltransferase family protein [Flammeovirga pacifica]|uniref:DNA polymerase III subunit beta n=1 Tax=Flammeovirga pacifica TaxID=915059 RepID=A0A1S1YX16_FLAPC|nr:nucleotidyltransferase domain-containing protein [Flammeovirga pacifica]OHX65544.1 DNA polymerase III subunit beta [Flammeovirga pacifica]
MNNKFGLRIEDINYIIKTLEKYDHITKAYIFGSRAMGNYKQGSDIDIAIVGEKVNFTDVATLHAALEDESPMPYFFDIVAMNTLKNEDLRSHIYTKGIEIYKK